MSSIGSNRKESRPMESQKLPESSDLEPLKSVAFSVRFIAKKMMKWVLESMENRCNE